MSMQVKETEGQNIIQYMKMTLNDTVTVYDTVTVKIYSDSDNMTLMTQ